MKKLLLLFLIPLLACTKETEVFIEVEQKTIEEMALPDKGIAFASLVAATLGHPVTYDNGELCVHPNINKWARYKPFRYSTNIERTDEQVKSARTGLYLPEFQSLENLIAFYRGAANPYMWEYQKPEGGEGSPYRIGDFRGYDHTAVKFFTIGGMKDVFFNDDSPIRFQLNNLDVSSKINANWEWMDASGYRYGVVIVPNGLTSPQVTAICSEQLDNANNYSFAYASIGNSINRKYQVYAFIARLNAANEPRWYYPLEGGYMGVFDLAASKITRQLFGTMTDGTANRKNVSWTLNLTNLSTGDIVLVSSEIVVRYGNVEWNAMLTPGEMRNVLGNITVPAGETIQLTGTFTNCLNMFDSQIGAYLYFSNTSMTNINLRYDLR